MKLWLRTSDWSQLPAAGARLEAESADLKLTEEKNMIVPVPKKKAI
jgi:hypothetical protein